MVAESIALCRTDASTLMLLGLLFSDDREVSFIMEEISIPNDESTKYVLLKGSELGVEAEVTYHVHVAQSLLFTLAYRAMPNMVK